MSRLFAICFSVFLLPLSGSVAFAQSNFGALTGQSQIEITLTPPYPEPNQPFTAKISNFNGQIYGADINWYRDGALLSDSQNQREINLTAGPLGESTTLRLRAVDSAGTIHNAEKIIRPLYLDIIVEPQTHVPDFYKGRALPSAESQTNATALLFGVATPSSNLVYTWSVNQKVVGIQTMRGQNKISFETPQDSKVLLSLRVASLAGETIVSKSILIPTAQPQLKFYEVNTLYGMIERPLSEFLLIGNSATVKAEPYYLDSRIYNNPDVATWKVDNQVVNGGGNPYEITIQKQFSSGSSNLSFQVQSTSAFLQGTRSNLKITY